jgi:hypothetical protein
MQWDTYIPTSTSAAVPLHFTDVVVCMCRSATRTLQDAIVTRYAMDPRPPALGIPLFQLQMRRSRLHKLLTAQLGNSLVCQHGATKVQPFPASILSTCGMLQICRESEGECDPAETCTGSADCPKDQLASKTTVAPPSIPVTVHCHVHSFLRFLLSAQWLGLPVSI